MVDIVWKSIIAFSVAVVVVACVAVFYKGYIRPREAQKQRDHELKMLRRQSPQAMALDRWEATPTGGIPVIAQQPAPQSTISPAMGPSTNNSSTTVTFNVRYLSPGYVLPPPPPVELRSDRCPDQNKLLGSLVGAPGAICNLAKGKDGK